MPAIPIALALSLAAERVPEVAPETLVAFAVQESRLNPTAIHDNTDGHSYIPATVEEAVTLATTLIQGQHHSVDLGIMQVSSANLMRLGLSIADAFDPERSMRAGGRILIEAYQQCNGYRATMRDARATASRCAASVYNTGNQSAGFTNGYTDRFEEVALRVVVPSVRDLANPAEAAASGSEPAPPAVTQAAASPLPAPAERSGMPNATKGWDVFAQSGGGGQPFVFTTTINR
jgi:type IV secretion system protein VirB1